MNDNEETVPKEDDPKSLALKAKRPDRSRGALFYAN